MRAFARPEPSLTLSAVPVKYEHVVFCSLSPFQIALYQKMITSDEARACISESGANPLVAIGMFQKLCNHPDLLDLSRMPRDTDSLFPDGYDPNNRRASNFVPAYSGKMLVLERCVGPWRRRPPTEAPCSFLDKMRAETNDKIVLISNYTETLDCFQRLLQAKRCVRRPSQLGLLDRSYGFFRLEGSTTIKKRQKLVDAFNNPEGKEFVFLLSSKAGGCGINLIGANRLILFDPGAHAGAACRRR